MAFTGSLDSIVNKYTGSLDSPEGLTKLKAEKLASNLGESARNSLPVDPSDVSLEGAAKYQSSVQNSVTSSLTTSKDNVVSSVRHNASSLGPDLTRRFEWELSKANDLTEVDCIQKSLEASVRIHSRKRKFLAGALLALRGVKNPDGFLSSLKSDLGVSSLENLSGSRLSDARRLLRQKVQEAGGGYALPPCGKAIKVLE